MNSGRQPSAFLRKSSRAPGVKPAMRYLMLIVLGAVLVWLASQVWQIFF
jgi:hypothetical protein